MSSSCFRRHHQQEDSLIIEHDLHKLLYVLVVHFNYLSRVESEGAVGSPNRMLVKEHSNGPY